MAAAAANLGITEDTVSEALNKREIKQYIDTVYLDTGYRNRFKLSETLDLLIEKKLEEADETEIYTNKDMADLLALAHKMRIEEMKAQTEFEKAKAINIKNQVNIQDNSGLPFGQGNYGQLLKKLLQDK
jgi:phage terminase small subunit